MTFGFATFLNRVIHKLRVKKSATSFSDLCVESFRNLNGTLVAVIIFAVSALFVLFDPKIPVPLGAVMFLTGLAILSLLTLWYAGRDAFSMAQSRSPAIIEVRQVPTPDGSMAHVCLLEPSQHFAHDHIVSIFYKEGAMEQQVAYGRVTAIQSDGVIQVGEFTFLPGYDSVRDDFFHNNKDALSRMIVISGVSYHQHQQSGLVTIETPAPATGDVGLPQLEAGETQQE